MLPPSAMSTHQAPFAQPPAGGIEWSDVCIGAAIKMTVNVSRRLLNCVISAV